MFLSQYAHLTFHCPFHGLLQDRKYVGVPEDNNEKRSRLKYLVNVLYPFIRKFDHDQMDEKKIEAKIQGINPCDPISLLIHML